MSTEGTATPIVAEAPAMRHGQTCISRARVQELLVTGLLSQSAHPRQLNGGMASTERGIAKIGLFLFVIQDVAAWLLLVRHVTLDSLYFISAGIVV
jgi:hypothetical protein